ncbi:MAG: glycosyltransferase family 2 protein [Nitrospiraceae bacterium]|nr:glycosyltransferase family 2 protein [Nitrospiraceae bacterium]
MPEHFQPETGDKNPSVRNYRVIKQEDGPDGLAPEPVGQPVLSIVVPVFNEEESISEFYTRLAAVMEKIGRDYEIIFVNDGSADGTLAALEAFRQKDKRVRVVDFSRNFGHQIAITAGMDFARGQAIVILDSDLQDPPEVIAEFVAKWDEGYEVVYGIRRKREGETTFKKLTATVFYRMLSGMSDINIPVDAGDFRLMDRKVVLALGEVRERNRYVRGLTSWVGFRQTGVPYLRDKRYAGSTKYPLAKMIKFALDAFVSFSNTPLRLAMYFGFASAALSFTYLVYILLLKIFSGRLVQGWGSLIAAVLFLGGIQLISLGIIGEYVGRINDEIKKRPLYILRRFLE